MACIIVTLFCSTSCASNGASDTLQFSRDHDPPTPIGKIRKSCNIEPKASTARSLRHLIVKDNFFLHRDKQIR